jgi:ABC-type multidrug transport system permease subunit
MSPVPAALAIELAPPARALSRGEGDGVVPLLAAVNVAMLGVLVSLDRLPSMSAGTFIHLSVTLVLTSLAALSLGLLASAAVADPAQATLALPMLCFPAVLFAGAVLPVPEMNIGGRTMSVAVIARWAFEALGHHFRLTSLLSADRTGSGQALLTQYRGSFDHGTNGDWLVLSMFAAAFMAAAAVVVRRRAKAD